MTVTFNHTIVYATDKRRSADFLAKIIPDPISYQGGSVMKRNSLR